MATPSARGGIVGRWFGRQRELKSRPGVEPKRQRAGALRDASRGLGLANGSQSDGIFGRFYQHHLLPSLSEAWGGGRLKLTFHDGHIVLEAGLAAGHPGPLDEFIEFGLARGRRLAELVNQIGQFGRGAIGQGDFAGPVVEHVQPAARLHRAGVIAKFRRWIHSPQRAAGAELRQFRRRSPREQGGRVAARGIGQPPDGAVKHTIPNGCAVPWETRD